MEGIQGSKERRLNEGGVEREGGIMQLIAYNIAAYRNCYMNVENMLP